MGVPFEALLPYAIITGMFGVTGAGLYVVKRFANEGKKPRWNRDLWDRQSKSRPFDSTEPGFTRSIGWVTNETLSIYSDGARPAHYRHHAWTVKQPPGTPRIRCQQAVEGMDKRGLATALQHNDLVLINSIQIEKRIF
ncbi:hypothetical protein PEBR_03621 [Penicillium brasilianum]|uniref:NADH dehydrogenase [ubiquinone] 1 alpha subcomplex subunit 1 n=1 Tax=Penicillium brasilianum TaxID=104259 RepID=A0A1S9RYD8_PENBI|nr:hypothetical protein PEBR_03621 [Penicillium brasilianum]